MKEKKYIIVGQGLVGSVLAYSFLQKDVSFKIYTNNKNHSTRVAAGLINPMVFKRLNKCFGADYTIDYAYDFYEKIEQEVQSKFIFKKDYARIFASIEEENNWIAKQNLPEFKNHLYPISENNERDGHQFETPFGQGFVKNAGFMNTETFLDVSQSYFKSKNVLVEESFDYEEIDELSAEGFEIIFCEGYLAKQNPFFSYLPLNTTKGDVIDISNFNLKTNCLLNKGVFVLPLNENRLRIGATYTWNNDDPTPSEKGKNELIEKLKALDNITYEIVKHKAGIRPTVKDRRPLIGTHPTHKNLHIINGMGTRGVALAPYWVNHLIDCLDKNEKVDDEVNISRFDNLFEDE